MSLTKYESQVKALPYAPADVYAKLADLRHLDALRQKLADPTAAEAMKAQLPPEVKPEQVEQFRQYAEKMELGEDYVALDSPLGAITLRIIERDAPKCLKLAGEGTPVPLTLWIQLLPTESGSKMKLTIGAEVSLFMKPMVAKPLQKAVEGLADMLSRLPYGAF